MLHNVLDVVLNIMARMLAISLIEIPCKTQNLLGFTLHDVQIAAGDAIHQLTVALEGVVVGFTLGYDNSVILA